MSEESRRSDADGEEGGVFGNLPGSRPGIRSPRRTSAGAAKPKPATKRRVQSGPKRATRSRPKPAPRPATTPAAERPESPERPASASGGGLEDIAWAGVAVAAEAATIGVRLASRAIEAQRGSTERD